MHSAIGRDWIFTMYSGGKEFVNRQPYYTVGALGHLGHCFGALGALVWGTWGTHLGHLGHLGHSSGALEEIF